MPVDSFTSRAIAHGSALAGLGAVRDEHDRRVARLSLQRRGGLAQRGADRGHAARRELGQRRVDRRRVDRADRLQEVDVAAVLLLARGLRAVHEQADVHLRRHVVDQVLHHALGELHLDLPVHLAGHAARGVEHDHHVGLVGAGRGRAPAALRGRAREPRFRYLVSSSRPILDCERALAQTDPLIGRRVRDFQITERIGRGGMGAVYRAEHLLLREPRALKVIRAELFQRRARSGGALRARGAHRRAAAPPEPGADPRLLRRGRRPLPGDGVRGRAQPRRAPARARPVLGRRDLPDRRAVLRRASPTRTTSASSTATSRPRT